MFRKAMLAMAAMAALTAERAGSLADSHGWLLGEWAYQEWLAGGPQRRILRWSAPSPNRFEGMRGGGRHELTFGPGGSIIYTSWASGQRRRYRAIRSAPGELILEERYGDYPQRVTFRREGDRLTYTVSALDGSRAVVTILRRVGAHGAD
jgi:hypothetical protein